MRTMEESIKNATNGLCYGNRLLLPFVVDILKLNIDNDLIMNFRAPHNLAEYIQHYDFTEVYFTKIDDVKDVVGKYETVKMIVVEKGKDIFDTKNHVKIALHFEEDHVVKIELLPEDALFIE